MVAPLRFDDRVAIITGAGRGLGREYALALAARGAQVVVNDVGTGLDGVGSDPRLAAAVAEEVVGSGGEAVANAANVADSEGAASIVADALERFGRIDIVINNAGILDPGVLPELSPDMVRRHLDFHALGSFNVTRAAWPTLVERGYGRVVMTASIGLYGASHMISYGAAKGAVLSLGRALADAGAEHGIKVNTIAPAAETRMVTDPDFRAKCGLPPYSDGTDADPVRGPERVVPMLLVLAHDSCPVEGETMWAGLGRFARMFICETRGIVDTKLTPEGVLERWDEIVDERGYESHPTTTAAVAFREELIGKERAGGA